MGKQYIKTERVHFMCPHMLIGLKFHVNVSYDEKKVKDTLDKLALIHPTLRSKIGIEGEEIFYDITDTSLIEFKDQGIDSDYKNDYKKASDSEWNVVQEGLLKVFTYPNENGFDVLFIAHHILCDGRGVVNLIKDFMEILLGNNVKSRGEPTLISGINDLPDGCELKGLNKYIINRVNKRWRREKKTASYNDYLSFFNKFTKAHPTEYEILDVNCLKMNVIEHKCQQYNVTVNSVLLSVFSAATGVRKITMTVDVRKKLPTFKEGTIGNYSTAMKITSSSKKLYECYEMARDIQGKVVEKLSNNYNLFIPLSCLLLIDGSLIDSMVMSGSGYFKSFAGRSAMKMFGNSAQEEFAITNLGKFNIEGIEDVVFIPPASPINRQTVGVITVNGKMSICDSYYSNLVSKDEVKDILSKVYKSL